MDGFLKLSDPQVISCSAPVWSYLFVIGILHLHGVDKSEK